MPDVSATIEYLQRLDLYKSEKPYWCFLPPKEGFDPDKQRLDNLEWEDHSEITIHDIRESINDFKIDECGFQVIHHQSMIPELDTEPHINEYRKETEEMLRTSMQAEYVHCYDHRLRENIMFKRSQLDLNDPLLTEGPARGAHNDITYKSGPEVICRYLPDDVQAKFLQPGYRVRIINTWRSLLPVVEDRPLALCDSRSVLPQDLAPTDRIIPILVGEVYYLSYNPDHKWYWLEKQKSSEPFVFTMYDTKAGTHARMCPHVSFVNPRSPIDAFPRKSIETRSIVITKMT